MVRSLTLLVFVTWFMRVALAQDVTQEKVDQDKVDGFGYQESDDGVTIVSYDGLENSVTIPEKIHGKTVTEIGGRAFCTKYHLLKVTLPQGLLRISESAFAECGNLRAVTFGNKLLTIGPNAFQSCINLQQVQLPDTVTEIGEAAFKGCCGMFTLKLGKSLTQIGNSAFANCAILQEVTA